MYSKVLTNPAKQKQVKSVYSCYVCSVYVVVGQHKLSLKIIFRTLLMLGEKVPDLHMIQVSLQCSQGNGHFFLCSISSKNICFIEKQSQTKKKGKRKFNIKNFQLIWKMQIKSLIWEQIHLKFAFIYTSYVLCLQRKGIVYVINIYFTFFGCDQCGFWI